jgi:diguanylate cyclase (GGDEF)-like protein
MPNVAELTLAEQLHLTERELEDRKRLLGLSDADAAALTACKPLVATAADGIVEEFTLLQIAVPEVAALIGDADTLARLKGATRHYIGELFEGIYDTAYVNRRLRIGKIHQRIGVAPKLYIAALTLLHGLLERQLDSQLGHDRPRAGAARAALRKLLAFDQQLVIDTYIFGLTQQVDTARREAERYASSLEEVVADRTHALEEMSRHDQLTGLLNQRAFYEALHRELAQAERYGQSLSLLYLDLDGFKQINDSLGHLQGDDMLREVGRVLAAGVREGDYACRYGGDEFCVVLPRTTADEARPVCERIIEAFRREGPANLSFSMGVAQTGPTAFATIDQLVACADQRMYAAKEECRRAPGFHLCLAHSAGEVPLPPVSRLRKKAAG